MKNSFTFYKSFYEAINCLGEKAQLKLYKSIMKLSFNCCENVTELEQLCNEIESDLEQNRSVFAQFLLIKPHLLKSAKAGLSGVLGGAPVGNSNAKKTTEKQANIKDKSIKIKEKIKSVEEVKEENIPTTSAENLLQNWYGEYANVHLTDEQFNKLKVNYIGSEQVLNELIEELSSNIVRGKAPPYDDKNENIHFAELRAYWKYRKLNGSKPQTQADKANEFKKKMEELTAKYRIQEAEGG